MSDDQPASGDAGHAAGGPPGQDAVRRLLDRARRAPARRSRQPSRDAAEPRYTAAGPDERDPRELSALIGGLVEDRKWTSTLKAAGVGPRWPEIVGPEVAAHCRPDRLEAGALTVVAESTAWATQLRLLSPQLLARMAVELGPQVVTSLTVRGPGSPDWRHGPLRVRGRGPRDTYG